MSILLAWLPRLAGAALLTIGIAIVVFVLSGLSGLMLAVAAHRSGNGGVRRAIDVFSAFFRSVPELVILFLFYFGLSSAGFDLGPTASAIAAFWLVGAAYDYQVFRGALASIPAGQTEAALSLGMRHVQIWWLVLLPQLWPLAKKGWITYAIGTVKRISIASAISVSEILYVTRQGIAATNRPFLFLSLAVVLYIIIVAPLLFWAERQRRPLQ